MPSTKCYCTTEQQMEKEELMKKATSTRARKELENKLAQVFESKIKSLSPEFRRIIIDDLVSAFENRLSALSRAQTNINFLTAIDGEIRVEAQ